MAQDREFDPDSLIPGTPTAGQPPRPAGVLPEEAYEVEILRSSDGTSMLNGATQISRYPSELRSASFPTSGAPVLTLSPRDAAMLGLYKMIKQLRWTSFDLQTVAANGSERATVTSHKLERVFLDWPDTQKESMPAGTALITSTAPATIEFGRARLLDETANRFAPGTILRETGEQVIPLELIFWCAHKDQRRGLEARILAALMAERHNDSGGRRILVPEYFSRLIRYEVQSTERVDSSTTGRANEWILGISISAQAPIAELMWSPGTVDGVQIDVDA